MATDIRRDSPLFDELLPVEVQSSGSDSRHVDLVVRILSGTRQHVQGQIEKIVHFEVTDDNDPYFVYMLDVGEQDFHQLKRDQSILVDFSIFPNMFIELMNNCVTAASKDNTNHINNKNSEENTENTENKNNNNNNTTTTTNISTNNNGEEVPPFMARINESTGVFSVIECNNFKQITHISLQLRQGNDSSIKAYLASRLNHMCQVNTNNKNEIEKLTTSLNLQKSVTSDLTEEIRELRTHREVDMQSVRAKHSEELSRQAMQASEILEAERSSRAEEVTRLRQVYDDYVATTNEKLGELEKSYSNEQRIRSQTEYKVRELTRELENCNLDRDKLLIDAKSMDEKFRDLTIKATSLDREVTGLQVKNESLEKQMIDKDNAMSRSEALIQAAENAKLTSDEKVTAYFNSLQAMKDKLQSAVNEINKGNQVISSMQTDAQRSREVITTKNDVLRRQETLVQDLRNRVSEADRKADQAADILSNKETELANTIRELDASKDRLSEATEIISSNQEVITWLNKELSRFQLATPGVVTYSVMTDKPYSSTLGGSLDALKNQSTPKPGQGGPGDSPYTDITGVTDVSYHSRSSSIGDTTTNINTNKMMKNSKDGYIDRDSKYDPVSMLSSRTANAHVSGTNNNGTGDFKDSYEYLRAADALGGMEDIGIEALGLEGGSGLSSTIGSGTGTGYYAGLLDVGPNARLNSNSQSNSHGNPNHNRPYEWQAAEFGLDDQ